MQKNADAALPEPRVGIGVIIKNDRNEVLLGLRMSSHGAGEWAFPGGHLEFGETVFETAKREVKEETDLDIDQFELVSVCDEMRYIKSDNKHYLNLSILGHYTGGEPKNMEPHKCKEWKWFPLDQIPSNMFEPSGIALNNLRDKVIYRPAR
ncbi:MAG: 8-oxo-dGTP diphosphatase [Candidatus Kaiserbacteria bacterium]|nr:8-oxo-dGTP diphosphatase [Candidatus Kaiserbacteria bacterium]